MTFPRALLVGGLLATSSAWAVYAPIPEQDQGKDLIISLKAGLSYDSNLFGAATGETSSAIWEVAPRISYSASLTDQTFLAASYGLTLDYFDRRPGTKLLDSHEGSLRLAHAFTKTTTMDVSDIFTASRNPESLLAGVPLNTDQSFDRNEVDGRFSSALTGKAGMTVKARSIYFSYRNASLGRSLDRIENLYGVSTDYAVLPELKLVGEYRHQDVFYRKLGEAKNKKSDFLMGGFDYDVAKKLTLTGRLGAEWRDRAAEKNVTVPYAEFSAKYDYAEASYIAAGYAYTLEETSDTLRFNDSQVHRLFVSVQHRITALITASTMISFEPSSLQGRRGVADVDEQTFRFGAALSYQPTKNWTLSANYDYDNVDSDDPARLLKRQRVGVSASYSF
jgi:opacity protein-like surface antigen